jgi:hypothetical protein
MAPKAVIHKSKTIAPVLQPCILALSLSKPRSDCAPSAGHGEGMDARVEATPEQLPDGPLLYWGPGSRTCRAGARRAPSGVSFSRGYFSFTPGILPFALRASFAVRARILRARGHAKRR